VSRRSNALHIQLRLRLISQRHSRVTNRLASHQLYHRVSRASLQHRSRQNILLDSRQSSQRPNHLSCQRLNRQGVLQLNPHHNLVLDPLVNRLSAPALSLHVSLLVAPHLSRVHVPLSFQQVNRREDQLLSRGAVLPHIQLSNPLLDHPLSQHLDLLFFLRHNLRHVLATIHHRSHLGDLRVNLLSSLQRDLLILRFHLLRLQRSSL
jgi:hypothetical protein